MDFDDLMEKAKQNEETAQNQGPDKIKKLDLNPSRPLQKVRADIWKKQEEDKKRRQLEEERLGRQEKVKLERMEQDMADAERKIREEYEKEKKLQKIHAEAQERRQKIDDELQRKKSAQRAEIERLKEEDKERKRDEKIKEKGFADAEMFANRRRREQEKRRRTAERKKEREDIWEKREQAKTREKEQQMKRMKEQAKKLAQSMSNSQHVPAPTTPTKKKKKKRERSSSSFDNSALLDLEEAKQYEKICLKENRQAEWRKCLRTKRAEELDYRADEEESEEEHETKPTIADILTDKKQFEGLLWSFIKYYDKPLNDMSDNEYDSHDNTDKGYTVEEHPTNITYSPTPKYSPPHNSEQSHQTKITYSPTPINKDNDIEQEILEQNISADVPSKEQSYSPKVMPKEQLYSPKAMSKEQSYSPKAMSKEQSYSPKAVVKEQSYSPKAMSKEQSYSPKAMPKVQSYSPTAVAKEQSYSPKAVVKEQSYSPKAVSKEQSYSPKAVAKEQSYSPKSSSDLPTLISYTPSRINPPPSVDCVETNETVMECDGSEEEDDRSDHSSPEKINQEELKALFDSDDNNNTELICNNDTSDSGSDGKVKRRDKDNGERQDSRKEKLKALARKKSGYVSEDSVEEDYVESEEEDERPKAKSFEDLMRLADEKSAQNHQALNRTKREEELKKKQNIEREQLKAERQRAQFEASEREKRRKEEKVKQLALREKAKALSKKIERISDKINIKPGSKSTSNNSPLKPLDKRKKFSAPKAAVKSFEELMQIANQNTSKASFGKSLKRPEDAIKDMKMKENRRREESFKSVSLEKHIPKSLAKEEKEVVSHKTSSPQKPMKYDISKERPITKHKEQSDRPPMKRKLDEKKLPKKKFHHNPYMDDIDDFVVSDGESVDYSKAIRGMFGYDKRKYVDDDDDCADMEASFTSIMKEEAKSTRLGKQEDADELKKIQAEEARERQRALVRNKR